MATLTNTIPLTLEGIDVGSASISTTGNVAYKPEGMSGENAISPLQSKTVSFQMTIDVAAVKSLLLGAFETVRPFPKSLPDGTSMRVALDHEDILLGKARSPEDCAIARALRRATGHTWSVGTYVTDKVTGHMYRLPEEAHKFIRSFDAGQEVEALEFEMEYIGDLPPLGVTGQFSEDPAEWTAVHGNIAFPSYQALKHALVASMSKPYGKVPFISTGI